MVDIIEVHTAKEIRDFIEFPLKLYCGCPYFVPMLYREEKALLLGERNNDTSETVFYLAQKDGKTVGRIQGILHKQSNALKDEKRVRFTRFDAIDDVSVARALFDAVEAWAKAHGMTQLCGPLGYNDMDREGLLVFGFEEDCTYEEQYNYAYYPSLLAACGFEKEVDWLSFELTAPERKNDMLARVARRSLELSHLHLASTSISKRAYIEKYADSFFDTVDACYGDLYGAVPTTPKMRKDLLAKFTPFLNVNYTVLICDEKERVVGFGLALPRLGDVLKRSGGRMTLATWLRLRRTVKRPKHLDLVLMAVRPEYRNAGINAVIVQGVIDMLTSAGVKKLETNMNLETNTKVMAQWKYLTARQHKRRRAYIKEIR